MRSMQWVLSCLLAIIISPLTVSADCLSDSHTVDVWGPAMWDFNTISPCPSVSSALQSGAARIGISPEDVGIYTHDSISDYPIDLDFVVGRITAASPVRSVFLASHGNSNGVTVEYFVNRDSRDAAFLAHAAAGWDTLDGIFKLEAPPYPRIFLANAGIEAKIEGRTANPNFIAGLFSCHSDGIVDSWGQFSDFPPPQRHETALYYQVDIAITSLCADLIHLFDGMTCGQFPYRQYRVGDQFPVPSTQLLIAGDPDNALHCQVDCNNAAAKFHWASYCDGQFRWITSSEGAKSVYEVLGYARDGGQPRILYQVPGGGRDAAGIMRAYEVPLSAPYPILQIRESDNEGRMTYSAKFVPGKDDPTEWARMWKGGQQGLDLRLPGKRVYPEGPTRWIDGGEPTTVYGPAHVVVVSSEYDMIAPVYFDVLSTPYWEDGLPTVAHGAVIGGTAEQARGCLVAQRMENEAWNAGHPMERQFPSDPTLIICGDEDFVGFMNFDDPLDYCQSLVQCQSYTKIGDLGDVVCPVAVIPAENPEEVTEASWNAVAWNANYMVNEPVGVMVGNGVDSGYDAYMVEVMDIVDNTYRNSGIPVADVLVESEHEVGLRRVVGQNMINGGLGELWFTGHGTAEWAWTSFLAGMPYPIEELTTQQRVMVYGPSCSTVRTTMWFFSQLVRAGLFDNPTGTEWAGVVGQMNDGYGPVHRSFMRYLLDELCNIPSNVRKPMCAVVRDVVLDLRPEFGDYAWGCIFMGGYAMTPNHGFSPIGVMNAASGSGRPELRTTGVVEGDRSRVGIHLPGSGMAKVTVYSAQGRVVNVIVDRALKGGDYVYSWYGGEHARGVYFVVLEVNGEVVAKSKLVNLR